MFLASSDTTLACSVQHAPYSLVFRHACVVIHSGAIGATAETLRAGKPMLVVPASAADQPDNAFRVVRLGVARTLTMSAYTADAATASLGTLLSDPQYLEKAKFAEQQIRQEQGTAYAADLIEKTAFAFAHTTQEPVAAAKGMAVGL
jgi:UDP:flavonoid glycosyltransferase YjiC (YdhE family)